MNFFSTLESSYEFDFNATSSLKAKYKIAYWSYAIMNYESDSKLQSPGIDWDDPIIIRTKILTK